jgi:ankyrin repeat protein
MHLSSRQSLNSLRACLHWTVFFLLVSKVVGDDSEYLSAGGDDLEGSVTEKHCLSPTRGYPLMYSAAEVDNVTELQTLIEANCSANAVFRSWTPLMVAAQRGHMASVKLLTAAGAHVDFTKDSLTWTALALASSKGYTDIVSHLLAAGADVSAVVDLAWTPMLLACLEGHVHVMKILLQHGARLDGSVGGQDCVTAAAESNNTKAVKFLLSVGAPKNNEPTVGADTNGLHIAAKLGFMTVAKAIVGSGPGVILDPPAGGSGPAPLHAAVRHSQMEMVKYLLSVGADPNALAVDGAPLHIAAALGHVTAMKLLLRGDADPNVEMSDGATPLHVAADKGHAEALKVLVLSGRADVNKAKYNLWTPLHIVAFNGHIASAMILAAANADLEPRLSDGATPLFIAAQEGHAAMVDFLLRRGATLATTIDGTSPLDVAVDFGRDAVVNLLRK